MTAYNATSNDALNIFRTMVRAKVSLQISTTLTNGLQIHTLSPSDIIGNQIQALAGAALTANGLTVRTNKNSQVFPDYYISTTIKVAELMAEIKSYNQAKRPAFDLANFRSYISQILEDPNKLEADYFVFGYLIEDQGRSYTISSVSRLKIWELVGGPPMNGKGALTTQNKRGQVYNLRPRTLSKPIVFPTKKSFVRAVLAHYKIWYNNQQGTLEYESIVDDLTQLIKKL